jgi:AcrR family transcriptional regulator
MTLVQTLDRITNAALRIMLERGVRRTSLTDVAYGAGVTRVTVHRYCKDKRGVIQAVCQRLAAIYQDAAAGGRDSTDTIESVNEQLNELGKQLGDLPQSHLLAWLAEVKRLYPDVYDEFLAARREAVDRLFSRALTAATRDGVLRDGINVDVLRAIFWAAVVGLIENPTLISSGVPLAEMFTTVTEVFRNGILKDAPNGGRPYAI